MTVPKINSAHGSDTRNVINRAIEVLNQQGKTIQDLVAEGQLTADQYAELIIVINGLVKSGAINLKDLSKEMRSLITNKRDKNETVSMDELDEFVQTSISNKRSRMENINVNDLSASLIDFIEGNTSGTTQLESVPRDKSVTPNKTTFLNQISTANLFDGNFNHNLTYTTHGYIRYSPSGGFSVAIAPIEHGRTYKVEKGVGGDRFNVMVITGDPNDITLDNNETPVYVYQGDKDDSAQSHTFVNDMAGNYLVVQSNVNVAGTPSVTITEERSELDKDIKLNVTPDDMSFFKSRDNLFDGVYETNLTLTYDGKFYRTPSDGRQAAVIPIMKDMTYQIKKGEGGDRFNVVLLKNEPKGSDTSFDETPVYVYQGSKNADAQHHSVKNIYDANFLAVQVSLDTPDSPELEITMGDERHLPDEYLSENVLRAMYGSGSELEGRGEFNYSTNLNQLYRQPEITGFIDTPETMTVTEFHALFDDLVTNHADKFERKHLGDDDWGHPLYAYKTIPSKYEVNHNTQLGTGSEYDLMRNPKVLMTAGIHGYERAVSYSMYYFFKELLENPNNDELLGFILDNVEFIGIPIVCASGFTDGTYGNRNGVNLNRTFPNDPGEVASQTETLLVQQEFEKNLDMDFFIDFHNINSTVRKSKIGYTITSNTLFGNTMNLMYKSIGNAWQKENPTFPQDRNYKWAHNALGRRDTAENFANHVHNVNGGLIELTNEIEWIPGGKFGEPTVRMGVEFLVNSLIGLIRTKV